MNLFTHCVLTASDERQAEAFRALLTRRIEAGLYPREIDFRVYPDPPGRVGSGGGTMWALSRLYDEIAYDPLSPGADAPSVLVLHAAGESRRLPVYAPEGKLFAPVPAASSSTFPPVVLDLQLALYLRFPWAPGDVVVGSGDVIIDFDTDDLQRFDTPIVGFGAPSSFEEGSIHGVFAFDPTFRHLEDYFQKQPVDFLAERARIEGTDTCALDIGIVAMDRTYVERFFRLGAARVGRERAVIERIAEGAVHFDLYLEQLSASLGTVNLAEYRRRLEGVSRLAPTDRDLFFDHLHDLPLGGHLARKCTFLHMGSVAEYPTSAERLAVLDLKPFYAFFDTQELPVDRRGQVLVANCDDVVVDQATSAPALVEGAASVRLRAEGTLLASGVGVSLDEQIPQGFCLDGRSTSAGVVVAIYHATDTFRRSRLSDVRFCNRPLDEWLTDRALNPADLGMTAIAGGEEDPPVDPYDLQYFASGGGPGFLAGYFRPPADPQSWASVFRAAPRYSWRRLNDETDVVARDAERREARTKTLRRRLDSGKGWRVAPAADVVKAIEASSDGRHLADVASSTIDPILKLYRTATLHAAGVATAASSGAGRGSDLRFVVPGTWKARRRAVKADQIVWARSPIRLDLGGGWTDTPPYTNLFGGAVTNVAVDLNGQPPIQVFVRPVSQPEIIFHSIDLGERERIADSRDLRSYPDPSARFALPRAACVLLGIGGDPRAGEPPADLAETLASIGGGFEVSLLAAVPKGSGLGTSSVLGGVILAALFRYFGQSYTPEELFLAVLELEQMLTTGGGWQDQIGGLAGGVKYIESRPGSHPKPLVHQLDPFLFEAPEYLRRMTLFYTGVTRLAKNILQQVVDRVNRRDPSFLFTHSYLRALAQEARVSVALRDYARLTRVVRGSWRANKLIHPSTTNEEIEVLLSRTAEHWSAIKLLGAGGGGYALFFSDTVDQADRLRDSLAAHSDRSEAARLVGFSLSRPGLQVSVS